MTLDTWTSYDDIAEANASSGERLYFTEPAHDLALLLAQWPGSAILDVGTGSGALADAVGRFQRG